MENVLNSFNSFQVSESVIVSGPLWTGSLHDTVYVQEMLNLAEEWGWTGRDTETSLEKVLKQMVDESDPRLPFGYIKLDEVRMQISFSSLIMYLFVWSGNYFFFFILKKFNFMRWYSLSFQVASRAKINSPPLRTMMSAIQKVFFWSLSLVAFIRNNLLKHDGRIEVIFLMLVDDYCTKHEESSNANLTHFSSSLHLHKYFCSIGKKTLKTLNWNQKAFNS